MHPDWFHAEKSAFAKPAADQAKDAEDEPVWPPRSLRTLRAKLPLLARTVPVARKRFLA